MSRQHELDKVGDWLGIEWSSEQRRLLSRYQQWLLDEAMPAGGIGPGEAPRLFDRHIGDALAFLRLIDEDASTLIDVGSGVGLPAIPIAIARPSLAVTLLDRSERRTGLSARALRILGIGNVDIRTMDATEIEGVFDITTFRAALRIEDAALAYQRLATPGGSGIFAWSRLKHPKSPPPPPAGTIFSLVSEGAGVLDSPAWLLRIQRS
jgi:16S rRNA (guanine527-N7)-methyltransferase